MSQTESSHSSRVDTPEESDILVTELDRGEWRVAINRPSKHNALASEVLDEIASVIATIGDSATARVIILSGAGERYFAAGGDLKSLSRVRDIPDTTAMVEGSRRRLDKIRECPIPVIAYLNGNAIGGGAELALACDMRLQAEWACIGYIQATLAITSAWGGGPDLCSLIGIARAMQMMTHRELIGADKALEWGLANAIIRRNTVEDDIRKFVDPMLDCTPKVLRGIKAQTLAARQGRSYTDRRAIEEHHLLETWLDEDHWKASDKLLAKSKK